MKKEEEITVEVDMSLDELLKLLESNNLHLINTIDLNDIYMIPTNNKTDNIRDNISNCVLLRHYKSDIKECKWITYKYKEFNDLDEIVNQGKIETDIGDIDKMKLLLEKLNFEELVRINDHMLIYGNETNEMAIQYVNNKHLYIEIEVDDKNYKTIDDTKAAITNLNIPIKDNNYYAKKVEIELKGE